MTLSQRTRTISALGIVEIFAWGTSFYLFAVIAAPIREETGWSAGIVTGGISLGLLVSGLAARRIGDVIQREGGRRVMAAGMALLATGLVMLGLAHSLALYFAAWVVTGLGMAAGLYDAAFSTLGRIYGRDARSAITALTLWGGFASTVCWPITAFLVATVGWRDACFAYAAFHVVATLPLCWFALPRVAVPPAGEGPATAGQAAAPQGYTALRFWCIAVFGMTFAVLASVWSVHFITVLTAEGYAYAAAVGLGTLIGPAQVGARVIDMLNGGRHHPIWTLAAAASLVLIGFAGLLAQVPASAALVAYGAGNGLWSIARGALPLAIFGARDYARIMGRLATPMLIAAAGAPMLGAFMIEAWGPRGTLVTLVGLATVSCAATAILWLDLAREGDGLADAPQA